jgi:hypothetical protein
MADFERDYLENPPGVFLAIVTITTTSKPPSRTLAVRCRHGAVTTTTDDLSKGKPATRGDAGSALGSIKASEEDNIE